MYVLTHHYTADIEVDYIERVTGMMTDSWLCRSLQDHDSSDRMAIKQF